MEAMSFLKKFFSHYRLSEFLLLLHKSDILIVGSFLAIPLFIHFYYVGLDKTISYADDALLLLYPSEKDYNNFFLIKEISGGQKNFHYTALSFWFVIYFLAILDFPPNIIAHMLRIFISFISSFSMYYFLKKLHYSRLESFMSAIFYTYNPFIAILFYAPLQLIVYGTLPFIFSLFLDMLSLRSFLSIVHFSFFSSLAFWIGFSNPPMASIVFILPLFYVLFCLIFDRSAIHFPTLLKCCFLILLFNLWFLYFFLFLAEDLNEIHSSVLSHVTGGSNFLRALLLKGYWAFSLTEYYLFSTTYDAPLFQFMCFLIPVFAILSFTVMTRKTLFFAVLFLVGLFLVTGMKEPLGEVYKFIFNAIPFFWIYRDPYMKFSPLVILSYCVLLSQFIQYARKQTFFLSSVVLLFVFVLIFFFAFPFFTGDLFKDNPSRCGSVTISLPSYWLEAANYTNSQNSGIFLLPKNEFIGTTYFWNNSCFAGFDFAREIFGTHTWLNVMGNEKPPLLLNETYTSLYAKSENFTKLLFLTGTGNIVFREDFISGELKTPNIEFNSFLRKSAYAEFDSFLKKRTSNFTSFGELHFYHFSPSFSFYVAEKSWYVYGHTSFLPLIDEPDFDNCTVVFFENKNKKFPPYVSKYVFIHTFNASSSLLNESVSFFIYREGIYNVKKPHDVFVTIDGKNIGEEEGIYLSEGTHNLLLSLKNTSGLLSKNGNAAHSSVSFPPFIALLEQKPIFPCNTSLPRFSKKNPVSYQVFLNISKPSLLVFIMKYHPDFVATTDSKYLLHYSCNGDFNCWFVEPGFYEINVFFQKQKIQNFLIIISFLSMSILLKMTLLFSSPLFHFYSVL